MSEVSSKIYLARAGGSGEDESYALDNGVAILLFPRYLLKSNQKLLSERVWMLVKESIEE